MVKDLTGQVFNRLTALRFVEVRNHMAMWLCHCVCGNEKEVARSSLVQGLTQSCGCLNREMTVVRNKARYGASHPLFKHGGYAGNDENSAGVSYVSMIERCARPVGSHKTYRDVKIDSRWLGEHGKQNFLVDMGPRLVGTSLGRFLDVGSYTKLNCEWQSDAAQKAEARGKRAMLAAHAFNFFDSMFKVEWVPSRMAA